MKLLLLYSFKRLALALMLELPQVQNHKGANIRGKTTYKIQVKVIHEETLANHALNEEICRHIYV